MQQPAAYPPSSKASSFAGLLAALTAPETKRAIAWDDDLEDDVATISYEKALRAHARYRPVDSDVPASSQNTDAGSIRIREVTPEEIDPGPAPSVAAAMKARNAAIPLSRAPSSSRDRNLKCASITIRLSQAECAQLRTRASDAGLSISAYLRSCTFEAEALRAEVKQTLAQLRASENSGKTQDPAPGKRSWFHWRVRPQA